MPFYRKGKKRKFGGNGRGRFRTNRANILKRRKLIKKRAHKKKPQKRAHRFVKLTENLLNQAQTVTLEGAICSQVGGWAYLRTQEKCGKIDDSTAEITKALVHRFKLKNGEWVRAEVKIFPKHLCVPARVTKIISVCGNEPFHRKRPTRFYDLPALEPSRPLALDEQFGIKNFLKGQTRALFFDRNLGVSRQLVTLADDALRKNPGLRVIYILTKGRPEEPTELRETLVPAAEIYASYVDSQPQIIAEVPDFALIRAQRLAELGNDVLIVFDGLTNWANALNSIKLRQSGKTLDSEVNLFVRAAEQVKQYLRASFQLGSREQGAASSDAAGTHWEATPPRVATDDGNAEIAGTPNSGGCGNVNLGGSISIVAGIRQKSEPTTVDRELAEIVRQIEN